MPIKVSYIHATTVWLNVIGSASTTPPPRAHASP
ncbi:MAG: hypothetical protein GDYSWBUE_002184, partial [Candidatus Fervidibacterota bacterium]